MFETAHDVKYVR